MVHLRGVLIQRSCGLRAEVSVAGVELCRGDAMFAAHAGELHAARDSFDGVVSHWLDCSPRQRNRSRNAKRKPHQRWAAKVTRWRVKSAGGKSIGGSARTVRERLDDHTEVLSFRAKRALCFLLVLAQIIWAQIIWAKIVTLPAGCTFSALLEGGHEEAQ